MPGHPHDLSDEQTETIRRRRAEGGTLEQIAAELKVHHSTVARYVQETETPQPADRYAELVERLRDACEQNLKEALEATESMDYRRMRDVMQRRNVLTQQTKGLLAARGLYLAPRENVSESATKAEGFLTELANGDAATTGKRQKRAASRAA
jgi:predicted transcriptional regulator